MAKSSTQRQPTPSSVPDLTGTTVGRFAIRARLGSGGMGEVYRADDTKLKRLVALKRMAPHLQLDAVYRHRFLREAQYASSLTDPHIAGIYDVLEANNEIFLVMEYVEGETLRQRLAKPLSIEQFLDITTQCAPALAAAHRCGIAHLDIKPENIMLTAAGQVKILDFGVAKQLPSLEDAVTMETLAAESGSGAGTPAYMAPEVLLEKAVDHRADIFSLGVVFYEALTGRHPFRAASVLGTSNRILHDAPVPLRQLNPRVPAELERIVAKMLAKDPAERYASAADLLVDLRALRRVLAYPHTVFPTAAPRLTKRNRLVVGVILVAIACAGVLTMVAYRHFRAPILTEHDWMLVTDFENRTGQPLFDETVSEALRHTLQQSRYVHVVPRSQVVEAARRIGRTDVTRVDASLGREICQRENCRALLTGEIAKANTAYRIDVRVVDPWQGVPVLAESASLHSPEELYKAVDKLAKQLRGHLGESLVQIEKRSAPLAQVSTPSLEALQRYSRAMERYATGDMEGFVPLAKSAVEMDPDFAMAHLYLAHASDALGNDKEVRKYLADARRGLDRVTERERYLILGTNYSYQGSYEKATEQYRLLTEVYPDDLEGYRGLADTAIWTGRPEEAIAAAQHAVQLDPHSALDYERLLLYLDRVNQFSEALSTFAAAQAKGVKASLLHWGAGLAYLGQGDTQSARQQFELLRKEGGTYGENLAALYSARVLMYEGHLREAADALRAGLALDEKLHSETWMPVRHYLLGKVRRIRAQMADARAEAQRLSEAARASLWPEDLRRAGLLAVDLGDLTTARQLLERLAQVSAQHESSYTQSCYENLKGAVELAAGKAEEAVESQRRASMFFPSFHASAALGKAYAAAHDWRRAAQAYHRYLEFKGEVFDADSPADWVLAHLWLARALARAGDTPQSLRYYDEFLRLWAKADTDLPVLREARTERQRLSETIHQNPAGTRETPRSK